MTCPKCGTGLEPSARFCGVCGHRLAAGEGAGAGTAGPGTPAPAPAPAAARSEPRDPYLGASLNGRFTIEDKLGEGGFGAVYRGVQAGTGRKVAIKLLHPEMTRDSNVVARFRREGQVLCSLRDAHTVTTYDFDQTSDGTLFIAMELLEGKSLHDLFHDEAPIGWQRMLKIMSEMCSSLEEAHALGIVHRDLKPENIHLETRPGNPEFVKILDFGIAKVMRGDGIAGDMAPQLTATGQTLGTLEYMSPEQLMGKPLDGRSDIYGLGVVAFEMITGRLPFPDAVGPAALISAQLKKVPPAPSVAHPQGGIPELVDQLILRMLEKDKNNRFRDMNELRREIDGILSVAGGPDHRPSYGSAPVVIPTAPGQVSAPVSNGHGSAPVALAGHAPSAPVAGGPAAGPPPGVPAAPAGGQVMAPHMDPGSAPVHVPSHHGPPPMPTPPPGTPGAPGWASGPVGHGHGGHGHAGYGPPAMPFGGGPSSTESMIAAATKSRTWLWLLIAAVVIAGGAIGAVLALS